MLDLLNNFWAMLAAVLNVSVAIVASSHAVLNKRDSRAAVGWVGVIWLSPIVGALLYVWLGINRIQRRAQRLRSTPPSADSSACQSQEDQATSRCGHLTQLVRLVGHNTNRPLLDGNSVSPLVNGDEAFPAMLEAIDQAQTSVTLCTFIFDNDSSGKEFTEHLQRAQSRGVEVRVLVDSMGLRYSWPSGMTLLEDAGIKAAAFLPSFPPWRFRYSNLRNHRKIMVVDGKVGFTGGMNVREGNRLHLNPASPIQDVHFRVEGPVVEQLQEVFALDWGFTTGEQLEGAKWFAQTDAVGNVLARVISDGPDEDIDRLSNVIQGAMACARSRVVIATPYLIPDTPLISSINSASMRGVTVDILIPAKGNLKLAEWASIAILPQLVESGCRVWLQPPPFDHSKLFVVDSLWSLIGSANWDQRSLRLNFELDVECYDPSLAKSLESLADDRIQKSQQVTEEWVNSRRLISRIRDGVAWLASPYL